MTGPATSAKDPRARRAARLLRDAGARAAEGAFVVDGDALLAEAVAARVVVEAVLEAPPARWAHLPGHAEAAPEVLRALAAVGQPPRVVAVCRVPPAPPAGLPEGSLVLARVGDAGNVGAIVRTAAALGLPRVLLTPGCADPWSRRALRSALGAAFAPRLVATGRELRGLADLPARPPLAAAVPRGGKHPRDLPPGAAVVLGGEHDGLAAWEEACCDLAVTVPAPGFESLNVAAAAAILAWELRARAGA